ncbi:glycosyltransferase [Bacillus sp. FSL R10-2789]|uniref:glycosyltransferase n=1 Tax=Bacillus sp. FSL R10-2789 TaxID=2954662 RepID=UPI0004DD8C51
MLKGNVLFIVNMDPNNKTGLFNATHQRIKAIKPHLSEFDIYCLKYYDSFFLSVLKKLFKKETNQKEEMFFDYEGIRYKNLYIKNGILRKILFAIGIDLPSFLKYMIVNRKKIKRYNLISAHWGYPQGNLSYYIYKFFGVPYVITFHGSDIHTVPKQNKVIKKFTLKILEKAANNFFVSKGLQKEAKALGYNKENYSILPNGIDTSRFPSLAMEEVNRIKSELMIEGKVVGYVGNLVEVKGVNKLPEIFRIINSSFSDKVNFLIVGQGSMFESLKNNFEQNNINVYFTGKVNPEDVSMYMNILDVLILPSKNEGWGNVILEAHACGTIAIGSNVGGIPEAIGDHSLVVENDAEFEEKVAKKVVEKLEQGYEPHLLIERVNREFAVQVMVDKELCKYKEILKKEEM